MATLLPVRAPADLPADRLAMTEAARLAWIRANRRPYTPEELAAREAAPWQRCPDCRREEAAHAYCSGCYLPMGPADWVPTLMSPEGLAARQAAIVRRDALRRATDSQDGLRADFAGSAAQPTLGLVATSPEGTAA